MSTATANDLSMLILPVSEQEANDYRVRHDDRSVVTYIILHLLGIVGAILSR